MTIKFRNTIQGINVNLGVQQSDLDEFARRAIEEATRIWLKEALAIVPTWSGASRATFEALADAVGVSVPIDPRQDAPNRIGLGRLFSRGGVEREGTNAGWSFFYETSLRYLVANETTRVAPGTQGLRGRLIEPTPYNFREAGEKAVQAFLSKLQYTPDQITTKKL